MLIAKVRYDNTTISVTENTGGLRSHDWIDLQDITVDDNAREYHLRFRTGRKARISFYYQGVYDLIAFAEENLERYARTS